MDKKLHRFDDDVSHMALPSKFTFPFHYIPHELTLRAAQQVRQYIDNHSDWKSELATGKMFGVLVVSCNDGSLGFLAAFSGNLAHSTQHEYFVPPVFDLLSADSFFPDEEARISAINHRIDNLLQSSAYIQLKKTEKRLISELEEGTALRKEKMRIAKAHRDKLREQGSCDNSELIKQSQFDKAELKRFKTQMAEHISSISFELKRTEQEVEALKKERKQLSIALQQRIFHHFVMVNGRDETKDLCDIFATTPQAMPPAGAGECAAPKMIQYALLHHYQLVCMGEFWVGASPKDIIRHDGQFYGACKSKCEPILNFMLQGIEVEDNALAADTRTSHRLKTVFEDEWMMIVNKPAGLQSVPGKLTTDSVAERVSQDGEVRMVVHRLDMATSGLIIIAKSLEAHKRLQALFKSRSIKKRYCAWLDGTVHDDTGKIELPLTLHIEDRPRQMVSFEHGKPAVTEYEVIERKGRRTKVFFYPLTGRTHQLRVHAAHPDGLNAPIIGDRLYGKASDRLYLHAECLMFTHPFTHQPMKIEVKAPF